jgi:3-deoxy-D-manno-octulosonic-acid transferase
MPADGLVPAPLSPVRSRWLYSLLLYLLLPAVTLWFLWRGWRNAANRGSLRQRLGYGPVRSDRPLWLHAASVGELRALAALLPELDDAAPILITVTTPTGCARARELFAGARFEVRAAPWDLPGATRRFLAAAGPRAGVFVETELWPNLVAAARARGVPLALVSARLSERSLRRYRRWAPSVMRETVQAFAAVGVQGEADRERFILLGAAPASVSLVGNLKFDLPLDPGLPARGAALRAQWAPERALWTAGSTHSGEEALLIEAQRQLLAAARARGAVPPLLAMAPRRPERFTAVSRWLATQGLHHATSSSGAPAARAAPADVEVVLIDQMGMLPDWYAAADIAFVGGSLVRVGGHNLLEPAALGKPVLTGPHVFNAPDVARQLVEAGGTQVVNDAAQIAASVADWLRDAEAMRQAGSQAAAAVKANHGAARRASALLSRPPFRLAPSASC